MNLAVSPPVDLRALLAADPGAIIESVARQHGVTCRDVIEALQAEYRRIAPGSGFVDAMTEMAIWGDVTVIVHTDDAIVEFSGPVPPGSVSQGYYNWMSPTGLHGHLRHERCAAIAFLERPFMKRQSACAAFINVDGGIMLKIFVGRDENRELKQDQLLKFRALADKLGAV
jgi:putative heme utilization carrier protein HutX